MRLALLALLLLASSVVAAPAPLKKPAKKHADVPPIEEVVLIFENSDVQIIINPQLLQPVPLPPIQVPAPAPPQGS